MKLSVSTIESLTIGGLNSGMTETMVIPSGLGREPRDVAGHARDIGASPIVAG